MKKLFLAFALINTVFLFAATGSFQNDNYSITVKYNETLVPGDAVFVRMNFTQSRAQKKNLKNPEKNAVLKLISGKKTVEQAVFYQTGKTKKTSGDYLCGIPLSPWLTEGDYSLKIIFNDGEETKEFSLPVQFKNRQWNEEILELDAKNSAIKTDNSPTRTVQISTLNEILETTMLTDVYSLKKWVAPTTSERYTAWFGDRRTYKYTNGKSSTSLHYGNDYGVPTGTDVHSASDGKVVMAENRISTGWSVVIEHLPGLYSLYYHMDSLAVKEGDMVKAGTLIGKSGATGLATGPHLHWEVRLNMCAVRPEFFLQDFTFSE